MAMHNPPRPGEFLIQVYLSETESIGCRSGETCTHRYCWGGEDFVEKLKAM